MDFNSLLFISEKRLLTFKLVSIRLPKKLPAQKKIYFFVSFSCFIYVNWNLPYRYRNLIWDRSSMESFEIIVAHIENGLVA